MNQQNKTDSRIESLERTKLVTETAKIRWHELEVHYARGVVVYVAPSLDLVDVAYAMSVDDTASVAEWIDCGEVSRQFDDLAAAWSEEDATVWCVVVKPWVLVQPLQGSRTIN